MLHAGSVTGIQAICEFILGHSDERLTLQSLAERAGLSPFHFQRSFKAATGVTPKQYIESCRLARLKSTLQERPVTEAIYEAGFSSPSRVYERTSRLGMTPGEYGAGGRGARISYATSDSPLGRMMLAATDRGVCFVQFADSDDALLALLQAEFHSAELQPMGLEQQPQFRAWMAALNDHLRGKNPKLDLPLHIRATAFQMRVWDYLRTIPAGTTASYAEVAQAIGRPTAARAVARACATNRVAILIPCHRVLRGTGDLSGYRWGIERKRKLLDIERR